ncbi:MULTISPECIES: WXG100 family type VII secretion target [unclassified Nocardia]|uniref:WXG100 family type VII secretion target n=1 Tax=unclassified Nocardia TaxID=2637762 RepID=UPI001CE3EEA1|nr:MULTISPECIES: WXG100 family type VII secretion target [unclassified Nocardia]
MADDAFRVDLEELDDIANQLKGFVGFLTESVTGVQQRTAALQSTWTGASAAAASEAFTKWVTGAQEVAEGIETMRTTAIAAKERYQAAVTTNLQMLGRSTGTQS